MSQWVAILSAADLDARYQLTASLDASFARRQRAFYETRTSGQLRGLIAGAWDACDSDGYQMARSHLALMGEAA